MGDSIHVDFISEEWAYITSNDKIYVGHECAKISAALKARANEKNGGIMPSPFVKLSKDAE